jgi:hypothetical protein
LPLPSSCSASARICLCVSSRNCSNAPASTAAAGGAAAEGVAEGVVDAAALHHRGRRRQALALLAMAHCCSPGLLLAQWRCSIAELGSAGSGRRRSAWAGVSQEGSGAAVWWPSGFPMCQISQQPGQLAAEVESLLWRDGLSRPLTVCQPARPTHPLLILSVSMTQFTSRL